MGTCGTCPWKENLFSSAAVASGAVFPGEALRPFYIDRFLKN